MLADRLQKGDEIRVIAPSGSLSRVRQEIFDRALQVLEELGYKVTFSRHAYEINGQKTSAIRSRVEDIHEAFADKNVTLILTAIGGFHVNQLLPYLDYELIRQNPKLLCGYSDITALSNAIYAKTGLVAYHGPHFSTFGFEEEAEYTRQNFFDCMIKKEPLVWKPSKEAGTYTAIQNGEGEGALIGGNLCTLNLLQGTPFMPDITDKILFIEDDNIMGDYFVHEFDRNLQSLLQITNADTIKGILFGRFEESCKMEESTIREIISEKVSPDIPVVFGVDFGHVFPMVTIPIGGRVRMKVTEEAVELELIEH